MIKTYSNLDDGCGITFYIIFQYITAEIVFIIYL